MDPRGFIEKVKRILRQDGEAEFSGELGFDEPMSRHTTFRAGGPADLWVRPGEDCFLPFAKALIRTAREEAVPVFFLGGGANLLVSDKGIRGVVLDTGGWKGCDFFPGESESASVLARSGLSVEELCEKAAAAGWGGLEFLAGMPGVVGGAVWMNARCYEKSVSDVLMETRILDENFEIRPLLFDPAGFAYKKSPFQDRDVLILAARFALKKRSPREIREEMDFFRRDRESKGHYRYPSAGSAFKNNRDFGAPTGKIIDELGLRGFRIGGAQVAPWHGNIIINTGGASAEDIRSLIDFVRERARVERGIDLEPEILFSGSWESPVRPS